MPLDQDHQNLVIYSGLTTCRGLMKAISRHYRQWYNGIESIRGCVCFQVDLHCIKALESMKSYLVQNMCFTVVLLAKLVESAILTPELRSFLMKVIFEVMVYSNIMYMYVEQKPTVLFLMAIPKQKL